MITNPIARTGFLGKNLVLFLLVVCSSLHSFAQPAIISFSPASGPVGTTVTVTGTNFSTTPANNMVFIGGVKANVTAATATSLMATVPAGGLFQPISITTNGLTAYSSKPFIITFNGAPAFSRQSLAYAAHVDSVDSNIETTKYAIGDVDGDNRIDVVTVDRLNNTMSVYRNTTTAGASISFAPAIDFAGGQSPRAVAIGDVDGDGRPDIAVSNLTDNTVSVFRNTGSTGVISFAARVDYATASQPSVISVTDIDKDGKPDLVVNTINLNGFVSVLRNTGSTGNISFAPRIDVQSIGGSIEEIRTADVDGDGKPDILLPDFASNSIKIFRNTSSAGSISFAAAVGFPTLTNPTDIETGDLNEDGKPDIAVSHFNGLSSNRIVILKNASTPGNIVFQQSTTAYGAGGASGLAIEDLDGDGKPDMLTAIALDHLFLYKNQSVANGDILFGPDITIPALYTSYPVCGDFDNDGVADVAFNTGLFRVTVWKNRMTGPQISSFSPNYGKAGDAITIQGYNFNSVTAVKFGGVPAASFSIQNGNTITAILGPGATGDVTVIAGIDSINQSGSGFTYQGPPVIFSFTPAAAASYEKVTIKGQNFNNASAVKIGGVSASYKVIDPFTIEATLNGPGYASGDVTVTNTYGTDTMPGFTYVARPFINSFSPQTFIKGTTITITGFNFKNITSVSLGGTAAASFTVIDPNTIQAVAGEGSSGSVDVTNADGTGSQTGLTYYPPPVITSFTPVEAAKGDTVTITGLNFLHRYNNSSAISSVSFGGWTASWFTIVDSFTIKAMVNSGSTGDVTLQSNRGNVSMPGFTFITPPRITAVNPTIIGPGAEVTITGQYLSRTTAVQFGGNAASSFTIVSDTMIKAIVGTAASGDITIVTPRFTVNWNVLMYSGNPFIYSVSPTSGPVGTTVTISGVNFKPNIADNIVYFGGVKANVLSAAANKITVAVPAGAGYKPISVVSPGAHQTTTSYQFFNVTFPVDPAAFNDSSFSGGMDLATGVQPVNVKQADVDGDGKPDLVIVNQQSTFLSVYRNLSIAGRLSFSPRIDIEIGIHANALAIADMDADGKLDLVISTENNGAPKIYVYRSQSTPGNLSFANVFSTGVFPGTGFLETADLDLDGRLDIICQCTICGGGGGFSYALNKSNGGNISFDTPVSYYSNNDRGVNSGLTVTDYDRDGKPDVIAGVWGSSGTFFFRNHLFGTNLFFDASKIDPNNDWAGTPTGTPYTATFTSQEYPDLVAGYYIFKNNKGSYTHALTNWYYPAASVYDLNGDGKQDLLVNGGNNNLMILKNTGNNSIAFAAPDTVGVKTGLIEVGDLDGDSKPEICILYQWPVNQLKILRNRISEATPGPPVVSAFSPQTAAGSNQVIIKGNNFDETTSVTFGGVPALYFTIISNDSIQATVGNGASGAVRVTTTGGTDSLGGFTFIPLPVIKSFTPKGAVKGSAVTIAGSNFTGTIAVSFGSMVAASFIVQSADTIIAYVGNGATGTVQVTAPGGIAKLDTFFYYQQPVLNFFSPASATANGQVVISGDHFEGVSSVSFGGVPAISFTVSSDYRSIVAAIGAGASGNVTVVNPVGSTSLPGFTYISPYIPSITLFTPTSAHTGDAVTIKGKYFSGATTVSFGGVNAASFTVVDSATIVAVVGAGASGNVNVITPIGTATRSGFIYNNVTAIVDPADVNSKELTVSPNPAHDLLIIKHPASVKKARLRFVNVLGREVKAITPAINATQSETSVLDLRPGVYTIIWSEGLRTLSRVFMVY
jgi:hypothetical protein